MNLPIEACLGDFVASLKKAGRAVLQAPPGAGKTSRVPLAMLASGTSSGKILMLEPRRLAARAAAERLAEQLGETPGAQVGYRMRGASVPGTAIEVVTEGILTRMIQSDPDLPGIGAIIFDEFHERSLNADLGLALAWDIKTALRPDLQIVVMSATLDAGPVAALLDDAPILTSQGRSYPVESIWLDRPVQKSLRFEQACVDLVVAAHDETEGGILVFLPGEGEIRRVAAGLEGRLPAETVVRPLYGALPFATQRQAILPAKTGRKIVLSTSIAETSLTIEDVRVVVDAGRARRARFDPGSGMSRLVTEKVSRAEAIQRAGRAGRVAPGRAYKLWTKGEDGALSQFPPAEIEVADLAPFALEVAVWGSMPDGLLTAPPEGALAEARALLSDLGALEDGRITDHGRKLARAPLHPRLAHMLELAGPDAAPLAALMSARDPLRGSETADLSLRLKAIAGQDGLDKRAHPAALSQIRSEAKRLKTGRASKRFSIAQMAALAYPDRIALHRGQTTPRYLLSGGKGAAISAGDPLASQRLLVATDLDGDAREAAIRLAVPISEQEVRDVIGSRIRRVESCTWSKRSKRVEARRQERLGAIILSDEVWRDVPEDAMIVAALEGVRQTGLPWSDKARVLQARMALVDGLPPVDEETLLSTLEDWLGPYLSGVRTAADLRQLDLRPPLLARLNWEQTTTLDAQAPAKFETPLGRNVSIDYTGDVPEISVRLQELFGQTTHPMVGRTPLRLVLLSPGHKPVQTTQDLPGFWTSSYQDVRRDMRGRYPKHPWPEDPTQAEPTLRAKARRPK